MTNVENYENIIAGSIGGILLLIGLRICYKNPDCTNFSRDDDNNENDNAPPSPTSVTHLFNAGKIKKTKKNKKQRKTTRNGKSKKHHKK
jgi:hypothetical protein